MQRTRKIRLGTAIIPTYPRHPLFLAQQVLACEEAAPGRLRLGIGPSHAVIIEGNYGIPMGVPLEHLREYIHVLRTLLWEGKVDYQGNYYRVKATFPSVTHTPILISALREKAFALAGELADGALPWLCPMHYLREKARPALVAGAAREKRARPALIGSILVAFHQDRQVALEAGRKEVNSYMRFPFYNRMFVRAGFPPNANGSASDDLINNLIVTGSEEAVKARLVELLEGGIDELTVSLLAVVDANREQAQLMHLLAHL